MNHYTICKKLTNYESIPSSLKFFDLPHKLHFETMNQLKCVISGIYFEMVSLSQFTISHTLHAALSHLVRMQKIKDVNERNLCPFMPDGEILDLIIECV